MNLLLDTCVISELVKQKPNTKVIEWIRSCHEENLFLTSITIGEIQKGISLLPESRKKQELRVWLEHELLRRFDRKILGIDLKAARKWGEIRALSEKAGAKMPVIDSLIAAIGIVHDMTVVTRNIDDIKPSGVRFYNPWE